MARTREDGTYSNHQKIVAAVDLPGVPRGTAGKIMLRTGFSWDRYRVRFANGEELSWIERSQLSTPKEYAAAQA